MKEKALILSVSTLLLYACSGGKSDSTTAPKDKGANTVYNDSIRMKELEGKIRYRYVDDIDTFQEKYSDEVIDSVLRESKISCCEGKVHYAPDSVFKIYSFEGESCGGYCNPFWYSYCFASDRPLLSNIDADVMFDNIIGIFRLAEGPYVVFQQDQGRSSSSFSDCRSVSLVSMRNDSIIVEPVFYALAEDGDGHNDFYIDDTGLYFCQLLYSEWTEPPSIQYDPASEEITYRFVKNYVYENDLGTDSLVEGRLKYVNGQFRFKQHTRKFVHTELEDLNKEINK